MSDTPQAGLPAYTAEELLRLDTNELLDLLMCDEDRVSRALIDECARRGAEIMEHFATLIESDEFWSNDVSDGEWWMRLHIAMILGLIPGGQAGSMLVRLMRRIEQAQDEDLQHWLAGYWPALLRNKADGVESLLRDLAQDRGIDRYMRIQAINSVVAFGERRAGETLDANLDWVASIAADESEDWQLRLDAGNTLLDFPRHRHRALLEDLATRQSGLSVIFSLADVRKAFSGAKTAPEWHDSFVDPWEFYSPEAIARRQKRWAEEEATGLGDEEFEGPDDFATNFALPPETYVRAAAKIGRNDPCPCGSGKKYKKCCLR